MNCAATVANDSHLATMHAWSEFSFPPNNDAQMLNASMTIDE